MVRPFRNPGIAFGSFQTGCDGSLKAPRTNEAHGRSLKNPRSDKHPSRIAPRSPRPQRQRDRDRDRDRAGAFLRLHEAAAGTGRSEPWKRTPKPLAHSAKAPTPQSFLSERRLDPAEPSPCTRPQRQPRHSATAEQVKAPGCMRRSFRTHRLCALPGVSPRAGMRCPVGALRTLHLSQIPHRLRVPTPPAPSPQHTGSTIVFPQWRQPNHPIKGHTSNPRSGSGIGPERA